MRATVMYKAGDVRVENVPDPALHEPTDAIVRVRQACICGSDLWPYQSMPLNEDGRRMGHEFIGVVEDLGSDVTTLRRGDLVVAPFVWADNTCDFCQEGLHTSCRHGGGWGSPGVDGGQGEAVRVPQAAGTLVKLPISEDSALLPSLFPELIEVFDNFAFDEVLQYGELDTRMRLMVQLAAIIACQAVSEYRAMLGAALTVGVTPVEVKEIVYQAVPYVGLAKVFDFLHATNDVFTARGIELPLEAQSTTTAQTRQKAGLEVQKQIVGAEHVDDMYAAANDDDIHIQRYLSANCFGDYLTRGGLDLRTRELLTFSMLAALGGCDPQVKGHVAGNLNVGNDRGVLLAVLTQLLPFIGYPRTLNALNAINELAPAP